MKNTLKMLGLTAVMAVSGCHLENVEPVIEGEPTPDPCETYIHVDPFDALFGINGSDLPLTAAQEEFYQNVKDTMRAQELDDVLAVMLAINPNLESLSQGERNAWLQDYVQSAPEEIQKIRASFEPLEQALPSIFQCSTAEICPSLRLEDYGFDDRFTLALMTRITVDGDDGYVTVRSPDQFARPTWIGNEEHYRFDQGKIGNGLRDAVPIGNTCKPH